MRDFDGKKKEILENAKKHTEKAIHRARTLHPIKSLKAKYTHKLSADGVPENSYSRAAARNTCSAPAACLFPVLTSRIASRRIRRGFSCTGSLCACPNGNIHSCPCQCASQSGCVRHCSPCRTGFSPAAMPYARRFSEFSTHTIPNLRILRNALWAFARVLQICCWRFSMHRRAVRQLRETSGWSASLRKYAQIR